MSNSRLRLVELVESGKARHIDLVWGEWKARDSFAGLHPATHTTTRVCGSDSRRPRISARVPSSAPPLDVEPRGRSAGRTRRPPSHSSTALALCDNKCTSPYRARCARESIPSPPGFRRAAVLGEPRRHDSARAHATRLAAALSPLHSLFDELRSGTRTWKASSRVHSVAACVSDAVHPSIAAIRCSRAREAGCWTAGTARAHCHWHPRLTARRELDAFLSLHYFSDSHSRRYS